MNGAEYQARLERISTDAGILYPQCQIIHDAEVAHGTKALELGGAVALTRAWLCFFLETVDEVNKADSSPTNSYYGLFVQRLVHSFQSMRASDLVGCSGYPLQAYTMLRNTFDNNQLTSACFQGVAHFDGVIGVSPDRCLDAREALNLRRQTEGAVRKWASGTDSGLPQEVTEDLKRWDELFDAETHGGRLSMSLALGGSDTSTGGMDVLPRYQDRAYAMFSNRWSEVGWTSHRLLPLLQAEDGLFGETWRTKWEVLDDSFRVMVEALTHQLGKSIGTAFSAYVDAKFPYGPDAFFDLQLSQTTDADSCE